MKFPFPALHPVISTVAVLFSVAALDAETLVPSFDSVGRASTATPIDKTYAGNLAVGPISGTDYFRAYLTFDLSGASTATGDTTLTFAATGFGAGSNENNASSVAQVLTLFSLPADWDGATQPGPMGTVLATVTFTPTTGDDTQTLSFSSADLTTAFNNAVGGNLYVGVMSDAEGTAARCFKWLGSNEDTGFEPQLMFATSVDTTPPAINLPTSPADDSTNVSLTSNLVATFNEPIALEDGGTITIGYLDGGPDTLITLPDLRVSVSGADLLIIPDAPLATATNYAVQISGDAVKDLAAAPNFFPGISDTTTWNFQTTADGTAPGLVPPTTPADGATDVASDSNLVATFDEPISAGTGSITIKNLTETSETVIPVGDAQVTVAGTTLTVDPAGDLNPGDEYAIRIDAGAITDVTGNPFAGILDDTTWNFATVPDTLAPTVVSLSPANGGVIAATASLVATFDEEIAAIAPTVLLNEDFESGDGGFTLKVAGQTGSSWEHGTPDSLSPGATIDSGNGAASGAGGCWGTNLGAYAGGTGDPGYYEGPATTTCLRSAPIDLTGVTSAELTFAQAFDLVDPDDEAVVNIIDDTTDTIIAAAVYTVPDGSSGWTSSPAINLSAGIGQMVRIEWCLTGTGGGSNDYLGWYVDDVTVTTTNTGGITLKNLTKSTETVFALTDSAVTIAGTTLTITPTGALEVGDLYAVQIAADALTDLSGNLFAGILDDSTWSFAIAGTLVPIFDSVGRASTATPIDRTYAGNLAVGPISGTDYFRSYLTFDLSGATTATGDTTLTLATTGFGAGENEGNTSSVAQVFTLVSLPADWDGAAQPGPMGTTLATVNFTATTGDDTQTLSFSSAALTTAFNNAVGGNLYLGIMSDAEGTDARSFKWLGSAEDAGFEPRLIYTTDGGSGGDTFAAWIDAYFPGETDSAIIGLVADPDGDDIGNGVENFFGTAPDTFSQGLLAGTADPGSGTFTFTHPQGTLASNLTASYMWSKDLVNFFPEGPGDGTTVTFSIQADTPSAGFTTVTATATGTPVQKLFVQVEVTQP